jgi:hypothetical protein
LLFIELHLIFFINALSVFHRTTEGATECATECATEGATEGATECATEGAIDEAFNSYEQGENSS